MIHSILIKAMFAVAGCCALAASASEATADYKHLEIGNDDLRLVLPDPTLESPYYQANRFTLPGMVIAATWKGIEIFTEVGDPHDPTIHNHVGGTAEEFDIGSSPENAPIDYASTPVGGHFVKIGVGLLERVEDVPYRFSHVYPRVKSPTNTVERIDDQTLRFSQRLMDDEGERGYELVIFVRVLESSFAVERQLTNLGTRPIETQHYSHNFMLFDGRDVDSEYSVSWPQAVSMRQKVGETLEASALGIGFTGVPTRTFYFDTEPNLNFPAGMPIKVAHEGLGLSVSITNDRPLDRIAVFGRQRSICPEPFIQIVAQPGETASWSTTYSFESW